jgi:hypothetical protein
MAVRSRRADRADLIAADCFDSIDNGMPVFPFAGPGHATMMPLLLHASAMRIC